MTEEIPVQEQLGGELKTQASRPSAGPDHLASAEPAARPRSSLHSGIGREEALRRLELITTLTHLIGNANHSVPRMLHAVAQLISEKIGDSTTITRLNGDGTTYSVVAFSDSDQKRGLEFQRVLEDSATAISRDQGSAAVVMRSGEPLLLPDITVEQTIPMAVPSFADFVRRFGIAGLLIVPIKGRGSVLGTLSVTRHGRGRRYDTHDEALLMEVGYRVAIAIENFTLIESLRNEVAARLFAREALAASEQRFLSIFQSATLGISVMDLVGSLLESNPAYQALTGYSEDDLIAMQFHDLVHPEDVNLVLDAFTQMKMGPEPSARIEHRMIRHDGSVIWVKTTFAAVRKGMGDERVALIFGITENFTERKQADAELQELRQHLQRNIELERLRLAQNLHDVPLQELYAVIYKLEDLRGRQDPETSRLLAGVVDDIQHTLNNLRSTASELRPPALSRFGLEKAIRSYIQDFCDRNPHIEVKLALARDRQSLPESVRLVLFRVLQEALSNIARHSAATIIHIRFSFDAEEARLEISDNGKGFTVPDNWMQVVRKGHYGLAGMAERMSAAGGTLVIESGPGLSTTIRATVPCG